MNRAIYKALKPGGIYGIVDHHAAPGMGSTDVRGNHPIERHVVVDEVTAAGFELAGETNVLENLNDPLNVIVFQPDLRGDTPLCPEVPEASRRLIAPKLGAGSV